MKLSTNYVCKQKTYVELRLLYSNTWKYFTTCKQMINSKYDYSNLIKVVEIFDLVQKNEPRLV